MSQTNLKVRYKPISVVNARFKGPPLVKAHAMYWHAIKAPLFMREMLVMHLTQMFFWTSPVTRGSDRV